MSVSVYSCGTKVAQSSTREFSSSRTPQGAGSATGAGGLHDYQSVAADCPTRRDRNCGRLSSCVPKRRMAGRVVSGSSPFGRAVVRITRRCKRSPRGHSACDRRTLICWRHRAGPPETTGSHRRVSCVTHASRALLTFALGSGGIQLRISPCSCDFRSEVRSKVGPHPLQRKGTQFGAATSSYTPKSERQAASAVSPNANPLKDFRPVQCINGL